MAKTFAENNYTLTDLGVHCGCNKTNFYICRVRVIKTDAYRKSQEEEAAPLIRKLQKNVIRAAAASQQEILQKTHTVALSRHNQNDVFWFLGG